MNSFGIRLQVLAWKNQQKRERPFWWIIPGSGLETFKLVVSRTGTGNPYYRKLPFAVVLYSPFPVAVYRVDGDGFVTQEQSGNWRPPDLPLDHKMLWSSCSLQLVITRSVPIAFSSSMETCCLLHRMHDILLSVITVVVGIFHKPLQALGKSRDCRPHPVTLATY